MWIGTCGYNPKSFDRENDTQEGLGVGVCGLSVKKLSGVSMVPVFSPTLVKVAGRGEKSTGR